MPLKSHRIMNAYLSQSKEHIYAYLDHWMKHPHQKTSPFLHEFSKSPLWFYKVALKYILKYRVGRFGLDQEADLGPKGTKLCSSCYGTASIFVC